MNTLKVLIALGQVPEGARITKRTGEKVYVVHDAIVVYAEDSQKRELARHNHSFRFLFPEDGGGAINEMWRDKLVIWLTTLEELNQLECEKAEKQGMLNEDQRSRRRDQGVLGLHNKPRRRRRDTRR
jgi:hypothetical protein